MPDFRVQKDIVREPNSLQRSFSQLQVRDLFISNFGDESGIFISVLLHLIILSGKDTTDIKNASGSFITISRYPIKR